MVSKIALEHRSTPHFVEWAVDEERPDDEWKEEYFADRVGAVEKAGELAKSGKCVILGEIGTYSARTGTQTEAYIYYWWNGYFDFDPGSRGETGVPAHAQSLHVEYSPFSRD